MALGCWGSAWNSPLIQYRCRGADCKHFRIARHRRCCHSLPHGVGVRRNLTAANALRALGQVFLMREKAVAPMSKFDFLISPTSPITAYAVDEATPGNDDWKPILRYRMSSTKSKRAARPSRASVIRIANSRRNNPSYVTVTGAARIERGQDGAEAIATLTIGKEVS